MPWIENEDGTKEYKLSIYAKEELPTWDEVYNEWYKNQQFIYDPDSDKGKVVDLYWKIPHQMYLLITICNQLNKMVHEDGMKDEVLRHLESIPLINQNNWYKFNDIRFIITSAAANKYQNEKDQDEYVKFLWETAKVGTSEPPLIYSIKLPHGNVRNPFITNELPRIFWDRDTEYTNPYAIGIYLDCTGSFNNPISEPKGPILGFFPFDEMAKEKYDLIIDYMMTPYRSYFENGIGWKDKNGRLITSNKTVLTPEFDPAK